MDALITRLVDGQASLAQLSAEEQDERRWSLLDALCGSLETRYRPNGFTASDPRTRVQLEPWRAELLQLHEDNIGTSKAHLFQPREAGSVKILFTITTCKRLQLFMRTMHSFLVHCRDCWRISKWLAVDDGSSDDDLVAMRTAFPFMEVVSKRAIGLPKGHASSLTYAWWKVGVDGGFDYILQMEDDWQFFRTDEYISRCIRGSADQVLINRCYAETCFDLYAVGGHWSPKLGVWIHDHDEPEPRAHAIASEHGSHTYWPGFSLRPGLIRTDSIKKVDMFVTNGNHFEFEFAKRWQGTTSYLPEISCWHIGRLTSERHDDAHALNAYELNKVEQFGSAADAPADAPVKPTNVDVAPPAIEQSTAIPAPKGSLAGSMTHRAMHHAFYQLGADRIRLDQYRPNLKRTIPRAFEVWMINLDRRQDRLAKFCHRNQATLEGITVARLSATDGRAIQPNHHWDRLASYGDFSHNAGMMGCAMSHIRLWLHLLSSDTIEWMIVLEDDAVCAPDFTTCLKQQVLQRLADHHLDTWSLVWLGFHPSPNSPLFGVDFGKPGVSSMLKGTADKSGDLQPSGQTVLQLWDLRMLSRQSMGGTHGYLLHKRGAQQLLDHIQANGMRNGIDWEMWHCTGTYVCVPPIVHAPSPVHPEFADTDIQNTKERWLGTFDRRLEKHPVARERLHMHALLRMREAHLDLPSMACVPVSKWLAQHPSLLSEWGKTQSWFWNEHDVVWFQMHDDKGHQPVNHPQGEQPLLHAIARMAEAECGEDVDLLLLSNASVVVILSPDLFDAEQVNAYFCMGYQQLDLEFVKGMNTNNNNKK